MSDPAESVILRLEALSQDLRKQGRASVAAQAAAEACLDALHSLHEQLERGVLGAAAGDDNGSDSCSNPACGVGEGSAEVDPPAADTPARDGLVRVLRGLLPFADSLDRAVEQTTRLRPPPQPQGHRLAQWLGLTVPSDPRVESLCFGVKLLQQQFRTCLEELGVEIDAAIGVPVDVAVHRVVEIRSTPDFSPGTVIAVVRPGYSVLGERLRDADVVASAHPDQETHHHD